MAESAFYFAYGSNMNPLRMALRGMRYRRSLAARLAGWQLAFNKQSDLPGMAFANIMPMDGVVEGVLYQLWDEREIQRMDPFESHPVRYRRECLRVAAAVGERESWIYIANPDWVADGLKPRRWYLNHLLSGRPWLSDPYYRQLLRTPCLEES